MTLHWHVTLPYSFIIINVIDLYIDVLLYVLKIQLKVDYLLSNSNFQTENSTYADLKFMLRKL